MSPNKLDLVESFASRIEKNNRYYQAFSSTVAERTEKRSFGRAMTAFTQMLDRSRTVLDIGCGTGTNLQFFHAEGLQVLGIEPSPAMRELAQQQGLAVIDGTFETLATLLLPPLAGIWCASSLLHVPREEMPGVIVSLASRLPIGGPLFLTVRLGEGAKWDQWDSTNGEAERFIQLYSEAELNDALTRAGLCIAQSWIEDSYWGRPSQWISITARK